MEEDVGVVVGPRAAQDSCRDVLCDPGGDLVGYLIVARPFLAIEQRIKSQMDTPWTDTPLQLRMTLRLHPFTRAQVINLRY